MESPTEMTEARMTKIKCPKCGSSLITDGKSFWCSFIGGRSASHPIPVPACDFGVSEVVTVAEFLKPYHERFFAGDLTNMDFAASVELELFIKEPLFIIEYRKWLLVNDAVFRGLVDKLIPADVVDENQQNLLYAVIIARENRRLARELCSIKHSSNVGPKL
jgi:predicted RNA-binding Zn-ribbon protein involved in translation (DUF1610 family)